MCNIALVIQFNTRFFRKGYENTMRMLGTPGFRLVVGHRDARAKQVQGSQDQTNAINIRMGKLSMHLRKNENSNQEVWIFFLSLTAFLRALSLARAVCSLTLMNLPPTSTNSIMGRPGVFPEGNS